MSQAFYRKWRPQKWDEVVSQDHVVQTLRNAVRSGRVGHAYLLAGPRGTGKTTTARLLAKALNCLDPDPANRPCDECEHCRAVNEARFLDLVEIDAASNTSVEDVRDLRDKINYRPTQGEFKIYIIDEVHMLSTAAFNALLKTLEEPPPHAKFILATTEVHKIPATILSRVQRYDFRRIPVDEIIRYLKIKVKEEGLQVDDDALQVIARQATGAMRDAVSLLDQLSSTGERVTLADAQVVLGTATSSMVVTLVDSLLNGDAASGLTIIQSALDSGTDARQFARQVVDYLRSLLLVRMGNANQVDATREMRQQMDQHARSFEPARLLDTIRLFNAAAVDSRSSWHPGLALELALAEAVEGPNPDEGRAPTPSASAPKTMSAEKAPVSPAAGAKKSAALAQEDMGDDNEQVPEEPPMPEEWQPAQQKSAAAGPAGAKPAAAKPSSRAATESPAAVKTTTRADTESPAEAKPPARAAAEPSPAAKPAPAKAAAATAQPAQPAGEKPAGGQTVSQHDIQQNWTRIKQMVKRKSPMTEGLLNSARSFVLKGDTLVLGFQSEVVKSKMEIPENVEYLRQALQTVLSASLAIRCVVVGTKSSSSSDLDIDGDGMVGTALNLGGKIVYEE